MTETPNPNIVDTDTLTGEMHPIRRSVLALGSNLGERRASLQGAVNSLADTPEVWVTAVSPVYETRPVDAPEGSKDFLNAVVLIDTTLSARTLLDRALWLLVCRSELWNDLSAASHDLLAEQPAPYGPAFAWIERHLNDQGPVSAETLFDEMTREDFGTGGEALVQRLKEFHEPEAGIDLARELSIVLDRLLLRALEDEQTLLFESGILTDETMRRARELLDQCRELKDRLGRGGSTPER